MSLEQISGPRLNYKSWQALNSFIIGGRIIVQTEDVDGESGVVYVMPTTTPGMPLNKNIKKKEINLKRNKTERLAPPLWFLSPDEFNNLSFVPYEPPIIPPSQVYPRNYSGFYKNFNVLLGNPIVSKIQLAVPFNFYSTQAVSQLSDSSATTVLLDQGTYTLYFNQWNPTDACGIFDIVFIDPLGNGTSTGTIDFNALSSGLNNINLQITNSTPGLCTIQVINYGTTTLIPSYDSNIIDFYIIENVPISKQNEKIVVNEEKNDVILSLKELIVD
jgi:hypothetical protein